MSIEKRLTQLEEKRPQEAMTWIRAIGETPEEAKARWYAAHPDRAGEPLGVIVRTIVDPPVRHSDYIEE